MSIFFDSKILLLLFTIALSDANPYWQVEQLVPAFQSRGTDADNTTVS